MNLNTCRAIIILCLAPIAICQHLSVAIGGGAGPASGNARTDPTGRDARPEIGGTLLLNAGYEFVHSKSAAIGIEVPIALRGSRSSDVFASGLYASLYTERLTAAVTPGVRVRFGPERRLSPWLSFGAGLATVRRTGVDFQGGQQLASQSDSNLTVVLAPGGRASTLALPDAASCVANCATTSTVHQRLGLFPRSPTGIGGTTTLLSREAWDFDCLDPVHGPQVDRAGRYVRAARELAQPRTRTQSAVP